MFPGLQRNRGHGEVSELIGANVLHGNSDGGNSDDDNDDDVVIELTR